MKEEHIHHLACPKCRGSLKLGKVEKVEKGAIKEGSLNCFSCNTGYSIVRYIPRFTSTNNYATNFGFEWNKHYKTQYDSYTGTNVSAERFFTETKWPDDLRGEIILEVGSGSGRFTEIAASTGALVVSFDYSSAVEANYKSNGNKDNVIIVQASIYSMPFRKCTFDRIFCFGVLQHLPDVEQGFMELPNFLKPGGNLVVDCYRFTGLRFFLNPRTIMRPVTKRVQHETLYNAVQKYINLMWPIARQIHKLPFGRHINQALLIGDYRGIRPLSEEHLKEWAILDTFDMLSPAYEKPQTVATITKWFKKAGLENIEVHHGYNGIEGRGSRPSNKGMK